jgi:chlorite dismutase/nitrite reductase/ring-hydroxylating ferredoxin subunit
MSSPHSGNGNSHSPSANANADRQYVKFSFFKLDNSFRRLPDDKQRAAKLEFISTIRQFNRRMLLRSYSLVGLRGDCDFMFWQVAATAEPFQELMTAILSTSLAPYLEMPYSLFAITRRSIYDIGEEVGGETAEERILITPGEHQYLFVYPFVKTRAWYALPFEKRQEMISEHIRVGRKYPQIRLNTTYSYGIDDQEFVVAFEGDHPSDFVDLVMELRDSEASIYTLRDTPTFTCRNLPLAEVMDSLGGTPISSDVALAEGDAEGWLDVLRLADLPDGASERVYYAGQQIALFNVNGEVYAISNRCSHGRGPLSEGTLPVDECSVVCPWHYAKFDLKTGKVLDGVAPASVPTFETTVRDGVIYLREKRTQQAEA